jgi:hypothetical protein
MIRIVSNFTSKFFLNKGILPQKYYNLINGSIIF